ncbi:MAG TPA: hypothetical protein VF889_05060 [Bacteroidota bacterium]
MKMTWTVLLAASAVVATAAGADRGRLAGAPSPTMKTTGTPVVTFLDINNISTPLRSNGTADINVQQTQSGFVFPKGSGKTAIYISGFLWGAKIAGDPQVRVGGSAYSSGLQAGKILPSGAAQDPADPGVRIYRVRPDWRSADLASEISDEGSSAADVRAQYDADWNEWPWRDGAPYTDVDGNGVYDPTVDIPGVKGASQTVWFVANDLNTTNTANLYGTQPLGVECQYTIWAYSQQGALGNMIFKSYLLINKSTQTFDSMYVCQWADPDLGNATDDLVGCDTSLSLGYVYNGNNVDATYGSLPPPAAGFDFFQGPKVPSPGDSAIFRGKRLQGFKNLPMTSFFYFILSDPYLADPTTKDPAGATQFYNFFRGKIGLTGQPFLDPEGNPSPFVMTGDPQRGTGWLDGRQFPAGDRRMGLASGPFTMAPGDTQEVVVAEIAAGALPGVDRISAVGLLKFFDKVAQLAYDNGFQLPSPPPAPSVTMSELDRAILLNWGANPAAVSATEGANGAGFTFQGYNVYQLPSASATLEQARKIATVDLADGITRITDQVFDPTIGVVTNKVVQLGTDSGMKRYLRVTGDALNGGTPLINGVRYYFAVTAYSYSPDPNAIPNNLENPLRILTGVPHSDNPGVRLQAAGGDTIVSVAHAGPSDGSVIPLVVDPARLTGHKYAVAFSQDPGGTINWKLIDKTRGDTLLTGQNNQSGDDNYLVMDGLQVKVLGPPPGMKGWAIRGGDRRFSWAGGAGFGLEGFSDPDTAAPANRDLGTIGNAFDAWFSGSTVGYAGLKTVRLKLAATDGSWNVAAPPADANFSRAYRYLRRAAVAASKPEFASFIVNPASGYAYQDYNYSVPFSAWDMDSNPPRRLAVGHLENNTPDGMVDGRYWPPPSNSSVPDTNYNSNGPREWFFIFDAPYTDSPDPSLQKDIMTETLPIMWMGTVARRGNATFAAGDEFEIKANHVNTPADEFTFTAPAVTSDPALAKADISQINVFPNPYYGVNTEELNKYQRFVIFNHLPRRATIRVFNLAGVQVRHIEKESDSQFERWDLANDSGLPVGSGLYLVHIVMPDLGGATKILKLAVVQEQQILDRF